MSTSNDVKINPADLAEHKALSGVTVQRGQKFTFTKADGPFGTQYGDRWWFRGTLENGVSFVCFISDNKARQKQLAALVPGNKYLLVKKAFINDRNEPCDFYTFYRAS